MHLNRHGLLHTIPTCPMDESRRKNIFLKSRYFSTGCPNSSFSVQNGLCRVFRNLMCRPERIRSLTNCCRRSPHIPWTKVEQKTFHHTDRYFFRGSILDLYLQNLSRFGSKYCIFGDWTLPIHHHVVPQAKPVLLEACYVPCDEKFSVFSGNGPFFSCR